MKTKIKKSFSCASVKEFNLDKNIGFFRNHIINAGDVAIFEVTEIGKHQKMQTVTRNVNLMPGDLIMGAFGTRYATNQFEGYVPQSVQEEFHILGGGGVIGVLESSHKKLEEVGPTKLRLVGFATDNENKVINTKTLNQHKLLGFSGFYPKQSKVILSIGSSMDSGKTTTAAFMIHGLKKAGKKVAYIKLTGTAYPKDKNLAEDMGADVAIDFSKYGFPSTFLSSEEELLSLYETLVKDAIHFKSEYIIIEIADGIFQRETKMLLNNQGFMDTVHQVIFSAGDSLSATHGVHLLNKLGIFPSALCGLFTASPLLIQEVREVLAQELDLFYLPILNLQDLMDKECALFKNHQTPQLLRA